MCRCHLDHLRPNAAKHTSNGTSVINDKDDYGHQTVLHPSNETTSGGDMRDGQQEEGPSNRQTTARRVQLLKHH